MCLSRYLYPWQDAPLLLVVPYINKQSSRYFKIWRPAQQTLKCQYYKPPFRNKSLLHKGNLCNSFFMYSLITFIEPNNFQKHYSYIFALDYFFGTNKALSPWYYPLWWSNFVDNAVQSKDYFDNWTGHITKYVGFQT